MKTNRELLAEGLRMVADDAAVLNEHGPHSEAGVRMLVDRDTRLTPDQLRHRAQCLHAVLAFTSKLRDAALNLVTP